jgi:hypothetical protein
MKQIEKIEFILDLYESRLYLADNGVKQPIKEMIKSGFLKEDKNNTNYLNGRIVNPSFLISLRRFERSLWDF